MDAGSHDEDDDADVPECWWRLRVTPLKELNIDSKGLIWYFKWTIVLSVTKIKDFWRKLFSLYICTKWETDVDNSCVCMYNAIWSVG